VTFYALAAPTSDETPEFKLSELVATSLFFAVACKRITGNWKKVLDEGNNFFRFPLETFNAI
jgi:hypothetical protein